MTQLSNHSEQEQEDRSEPTGASQPAWQRVQQIWRRAPQRFLLTALFCIVALAFNLYRLGAPGIWFDEAFSVELASQPLPLLWYIIFGLEPNMELYYLFLHFWLGLTSLVGLNPTEFVVRFPSAIFAALSAGVVFAWGRKFLNTTAGVVGAALYLLNYLQLIYAQQTRAYSLQLLFTCVAWYALFSALIDGDKRKAPARTPDRPLSLHGGGDGDKRKAPTRTPDHPLSLRVSYAWRWWICYTVVTVMAIYTHLFSGLIVLAQLVAVAGIVLIPNSWRVGARAQLKALLISLGATAILIIPMLLVAHQGAKTGWLPVPHRQDLIQLVLMLSGYHNIYLVALAGCLALGIALLASGHGRSLWVARG